MFQQIHTTYDLFEAFIHEEDIINFIQLCSILLVYTEIEFNKFKEIQEKNNRSKKQIDLATERINNKYLHKLIFYFQQVEIYFERFLQLNNIKVDEFFNDYGLIKDVRYFQIRCKPNLIEFFKALNCLNNS